MSTSGLLIIVVNDNYLYSLNRNLYKIATVLQTDKNCHIVAKQLSLRCITYNTVQNSIISKPLPSMPSSANTGEHIKAWAIQASKHYSIIAKHYHNAHCKPLDSPPSHVLSLVYSNLAKRFAMPHSVSATYNRRSFIRCGKGFEASNDI